MLTVHKGVASGKCGFTTLSNRTYQHFDIKPTLSHLMEIKTLISLR
jgi:hypothetical protein